MGIETAIKTRAICRIPLVGCLKKAEEYKSLTSDWQSRNEEQNNFLRHLRLADELSVFTKEEFDSIVSEKSDEIDKWLSDNGFTLKCPEIRPGEFATASFIKMFVKWLSEGEKNFITSDNTKHPAVFFKEENGKTIKINNTSWGITSLSTKEGDVKVYCAMPTDGDFNFNETSEEEILNIASDLEIKYTSAPSVYKGVKLPMIDLDIEVNQQWLKGLQNGEWEVAECIQQFILKLNEKGATAKSAAVMLFVKSAMRIQTPVLTFDKPFLLWFSKNGVFYPAFLAVCGTDCWKEPTNLD